MFHDMMRRYLENIWRFFGFTQEAIGRSRYFAINTATSFGLLLVIFGISVIIYVLEYPLNLGLSSLPGFLLEVSFMEAPLGVFIGYLASMLLLVLMALWIVSIIFTIVVNVKATIRRVRDIGIARNWWVLALIPFINLFFFIYLSLEKSGAGREGSFSLTDLTREQFRRFFSHELSKSFLFISFSVIVVGSIYAGSTVSNLKQDIDIRIEQRKAELDIQYDAEEKFRNAVFMASEKGKCFEIIKKYGNEGRAYPECRSMDVIDFSRLKRALERAPSEIIRPYISDIQYRELEDIKNTPSFLLFFEKFSLGFWGVIALVAMFLINILFAFLKFLKERFPVIIGAGGIQVKSMKTDIEGMAVFQRYLLFIALLILIILVLILIKL